MAPGFFESNDRRRRKKIASLVPKGLKAQGFVVEGSPHGDEGFALATSRLYDVAILDIMLPGNHGHGHSSITVSPCQNLVVARRNPYDGRGYIRCARMIGHIFPQLSSLGEYLIAGMGIVSIVAIGVGFRGGVNL